MAPTVGRIVHYQLSEQDADQIKRRRAENPLTDVGNMAQAADVYPAIVTRVWGPGSDSLSVQLQVFLDGNDVLWATSRQEGDEPGQWSWPPRGE